MPTQIAGNHVVRNTAKEYLIVLVGDHVVHRESDGRSFKLIDQSKVILEDAYSARMNLEEAKSASEKLGGTIYHVTDQTVFLRNITEVK